MLLRGFAICFVLAFANSVQAVSVRTTSTTETTPVCNEVRTSLPWKYCFSAGVGKNAHKLILQFHGGGESEKTWFDPGGYAEPIRQTWKSKGLDAPSVVTISFGPMWVLSRKTSLPKSGLYEVFVNEIFPFIEKQLMSGQVAERIIVGDSMGGFNAGVFALKKIELFTKIALLCPALGVEGEEASKDIDSYIRQTGARMDHAQFIFKIRDEYFLSPEQQNALSPLTLVKTLVPEGKVPKFFLSCGDKDQFGFFHGAGTFVKNAKAQGFDVVWKPISNGSHCSVDMEALADFLL